MLADLALYLVVLAAGVLVVAAVLLWRLMADRRQLSRYGRRLQSFDPAVRAKAGEQLAELGLARGAVVLLDHVSNEEEDQVRLAIAVGVARSRAGPTGSRRVNHLRSWAAEELARQGYGVMRLGPAGGSVPVRLAAPSGRATIRGPIVKATPDRPPDATSTDPDAEPEPAPIRWRAPEEQLPGAAT